MNISNSKFIFKTKSETLSDLSHLVLKSIVPKLYYFSKKEWDLNSSQILEHIKNNFFGSNVAVRSSALTEDTLEGTMAGVYFSQLHVFPMKQNELKQAIQNVFKSMGEEKGNQVLIQAMIDDVSLSGVIMTRTMESGSPYYTINYDDTSGKTDTVTGGTGVSKTLRVWRSFSKANIESGRIKLALRMAQELEKITQTDSLDIEFVVPKKGLPFLLQVRQIFKSPHWKVAIDDRIEKEIKNIEHFISERSKIRPGIVGERICLGVMPDWNPAEIIGIIPKPLAMSLYRRLITQDVWQSARSSMGYKRVPGEELMVNLCGRPYIDVRSSLNSFLPDDLSHTIGEKLVNSWLAKLGSHPELHDKLEFDVAITCYDFNFDDSISSSFYDLDKTEVEIFRDKIKTLTYKAIKNRAHSFLDRIKNRANIKRLWKVEEQYSDFSKISNLGKIQMLLEEIKKTGTYPFAIIARHAFIAESLLRSAVQKGALSAERLSEFKRSTPTISSQISSDLNKVCKGQMAAETFMEMFGHLRPGTYDICSQRYADRKDILQEPMGSLSSEKIKKFALSGKEESALNNLLKEAKLSNITATELFEYAEEVISGREFAKFVFTREVSDVLEELAVWGNSIGLNRHSVSFLDLEDIMRPLQSSLASSNKSFFLEKIYQAEQEDQIAHLICLPHLIRTKNDLWVVPQHRSQANFIGHKQVIGPIVRLSTDSLVDVSISGRIVCIENADPGYDWIFSKNILGLVTKYGGSNSHMAIRCAEYGLPGAIGCGEHLFHRINQTGIVDLDCAKKILRAVRGS